MKLAVVNQAYLEQADEDDFSVAGTSYHNVDVRATYNDLVRALGQPTYSEASEDGKVNVEWWGYVEDNQGVKVPNSEWTLYDWKESENPKDNPTEIYEWHIGAKGSISADNVQDLTVRELPRVKKASREAKDKYSDILQLKSFCERNGIKCILTRKTEDFNGKLKDRDGYKITFLNGDVMQSADTNGFFEFYNYNNEDDRKRISLQNAKTFVLRYKSWLNFNNKPNANKEEEKIDEGHTNDIIDEALRGVYGDDFVNDLYERTAGASSEMDEDSCVDITGETWVNQDELNSMRSVAEDKYGLQVVPNEHNGYTFLGKKGKLLEFFKSFLDDEEAERLVDAHHTHLFDEGWY